MFTKLQSACRSRSTRALIALAGLVALPMTAGADDRNRCPASSYSSSFRTYLGPGWTTLAGRYGPCQSSGVKREYHEGQQIRVTRVTTHGQTISRGRRYGYGSSVWYYTSDHCWVWSGGTDNPVWNK